MTASGPRRGQEANSSSNISSFDPCHSSLFAIIAGEVHEYS